MSTFPQFLYETLLGGGRALEDGAQFLFRAESKATKDLASDLRSVGSTLNVPETDDIVKDTFDGVADIVYAADVEADWAWFKHIFSSLVVTILVGLGTFLILYLLG